MALSPKLLMQHSLSLPLAHSPVPGHPQGCLSSYSAAAAAAAPLALLSLILNSFPSVPASLWLGGNEAPCQGLASSAVRPESFFACGRVIACNRCERQNLQWLPQGSRAGEIEREGERKRWRGKHLLRVQIKFKFFCQLELLRFAWLSLMNMIMHVLESVYILHIIVLYAYLPVHN